MGWRVMRIESRERVDSPRSAKTENDGNWDNAVKYFR
jgi:hypothetical protein